MVLCEFISLTCDLHRRVRAIRYRLRKAESNMFCQFCANQIGESDECNSCGSKKVDGQWQPGPSPETPEAESAAGSDAASDDGTETPNDDRSRRSTIKLVALVAVLALVLGFAGGFAGSEFHKGSAGTTGEVGPEGPPGLPGAPGLIGLTGAPGAAAVVGDLGLCFDTSYSNPYGDTYLTGVYLSTVQKHPDGTTYCSSGRYIPVAPQNPDTPGG